MRITSTTSGSSDYRDDPTTKQANEARQRSTNRSNDKTARLDKQAVNRKSIDAQSAEWSRRKEVVGKSTPVSRTPVWEPPGLRELGVQTQKAKWARL
jgi:hypothetical protein